MSEEGASLIVSIVAGPCRFLPPWSPSLSSFACSWSAFRRKKLGPAPRHGDCGDLGHGDCQHFGNFQRENVEWYGNGSTVIHDGALENAIGLGSWRDLVGEPSSFRFRKRKYIVRRPSRRYFGFQSTLIFLSKEREFYVSVWCGDSMISGLHQQLARCREYEKV